MSQPNNLTVYFATDHAGFSLKQDLLVFVRDELGIPVEDCGAFELDSSDDYPDYISKAAKAVSEKPAVRKAIILGGSGQGEAMVANRFTGVRAAVYYGEPSSKQTDESGEELGIVKSSRVHNDANVLSLGARFIGAEEAKEMVSLWLKTEFSNDDRHKRRIIKIDRI